MKKHGRSVCEDIKLVVRGVKEFEKLLPRQMLLVAFKCIIGASLPYVAIILSTLIINELTGNQRHQRLLVYVLLSVGLSLVLYVVKAVLEAKISVGYSRLFSTHELLLTDKSYKLPYAQLESMQVRNLREQVSGSINVSGAGMASLYWDIEVVFTNLCSAAISLIMCMNFFAELLKGNVDQHFLLGYFVCLVVLVTLCSWVSCKMTGKRFDVAMEVFEEGTKYKRFGEFYTLEYLSNEDAALDVRIFKQKDFVLNETWKRCYEHFAKGKEKELRAASLYDGVKLTCTALCGAAVYLIVGLLVRQGSIGIGNVVMLHGAVTGLILSLSELAQIWTDLRNNNEHLVRFFEYMDLPEEDYCEKSEQELSKQDNGASTEDNIKVPGGKALILQKQKADILGNIKEIQFEHVSFRYPNTTTWVLQDVNLNIKAGEKLALVGRNGSGKTTLIKLLCRLYEPTKGRILLNGKDIRSYSKVEYWKLIATVFQDFSMFAFSVGENVAAGFSYDAKRVEAILQQVGLGEKLSGWTQGVNQSVLHGYDEKGENLSGGEAQKLAIARALYKDTLLMILDEPTAALDPYAEFEIYEQFRKLTENKTVLSISHRLSSCRMCDRILVLEAGKLVQCGTHEELLAWKQGKYYEMWQAQAQYYC